MRLYQEQVLLVFSLLAAVASAARIDMSEAECAARAFAAEGRHLTPGLGSLPREAREHAAADGTAFFSVRMTGGGTVFLSGDDRLEPVIAFTSADIDFENLDHASPLYALLNGDQRTRRVSSDAPAKWNRLLASGDSLPAYPSLLSVVALASKSAEPGDLRVPALVETQWDQENVSSNKCYNLYTPGNVCCGCVATAMSQVMRYHRWPDAEHEVAAGTFPCTYNGAATNLTMQGGVYDWSLMALGTSADPIDTDDECAAIGKLTSDAGISVKMGYTSSGSGTYSAYVADAFIDTWRYGQTTYLYDYATWNYGYIDGKYGAESRLRTLRQALFSNFDCGHPVMLGIGNDSNEGHCIVADGYGYEGDTDYVHLNLGWSGSYDLWYNLPSIGTSYSFNSVSEVVYNIFPTNDTACAAFSGRVLDASANGVAAAKVTIRRSDTSEVVAEMETSDAGVYGAVLPGGVSYDVVAVSSNMTMTGMVSSVALASPVVEECWDDKVGLLTTRLVTPDGTIGNSWGNDVVLGIEIEKRTMPTNFYVSASSGVDAPERGTSAAPYATIQYAITNGQDLVAGDTINVLPGVYHGCVTAPSTRISIVSSEGPEATVLDGDGLDCCYRGSANSQSVLSGFVITNGANYGGIYCGTATNCIVLNCENSNGGSGGGAYGATLHGCVLHNNESYYGGGAANCVLVNCTVYDNWAYWDGGGVDRDCVVTNSIVWRNHLENSDEDDNWELYSQRIRGKWYYYKPSFAYSCTYPTGFTDRGGNITNNPQCVSFDIDDWRLRSGSPCAGTALGGLNMGAWQGEPLVGFVITAEANGRGTVSPWSQFVLAGEGATFKAIGDHPFLGFETNGIAVASGREYTWPEVWSDGTLTANFGVTNYFIDAASGDDANDGLSPTAPLKSIYAMTQKAGRGDKVKVAPGVYEPCDWCVYGVEVESSGGAANTIVDGGGTNRCIYADEMTYRGFTFCNGAALLSYGGGVYGGAFVDCVISNCTAIYGGGAAYATLTNCLVVGNSAARYRRGPNWYGGYGAGAYASDLNNCTLFGNAAYECSMTNTIDTSETSHFRNAANGDFRLKPASAFVDTGDDACVAIDHDLAGTNRVWGTSVDIGCFEYHLPPSVADPTEIGIAAALAQEGYAEGYAEAITDPKDYAYLVEWTSDHGLTSSDLNGSSTGFVSPGLNADGLIELESTNVVLQSFAPFTDGVWRVELSLPGYDRSRINVPLLKAAIGIVGSESVDGGYSSDDLELLVTPCSTNIAVTVLPPSDATNYFMKATVR